MKPISPNEWCFILDLIQGTKRSDAIKDHNTPQFTPKTPVNVSRLAKKLEYNWDESLAKK